MTQTTADGYPSYVPFKKYLTTATTIGDAITGGVGNSVLAEGDLAAAGTPEHIVPLGGRKTLIILPYATTAADGNTFNIRLTFWDYYQDVSGDANRDISARLYIPSESMESLVTLSSRTTSAISQTITGDDLTASSTFFADTITDSASRSSYVNQTFTEVELFTGTIVPNQAAAGWRIPDTRGAYGWSMTFDQISASIEMNALYRMC
jgi:hypothetical protein